MMPHRALGRVARVYPLLARTPGFIRLGIFLFIAAAACSEAEPIQPSVPLATTVSLSSSTANFSSLTDTLRLVATVKDQTGKPMQGATLSWVSSNTQVATVSSTGLVTSVGNGSAQITVSAGTATAAATVVVQQVAASMEVTPSRAFLVTADTLVLQATVRDSAGAAIAGHPVTWSVSDPTVADVSGTGRVVPKKAGEVTVRATASGKTGQTVLTINVGAGLRVPELAVYDSVVPQLLATYKLPGASFAVMKDGKLLAVRTFGWADTVARQPVEPKSIFRYASLSKPMTATAIMKLVQEGRLSLDQRIFSLVPGLQPPAGSTPDPRLANITVLHALTHTTGWHAPVTQDPLWSGRAASQALNESYPASARTFARYWMSKPLTYDPGTTFSYGQIGYILLHLVIEQVTGMTYEQYVRDNLLTFAGASSIQPGRTRLSGRLPNEVRYYYYPGDMPDNTAPTGTAPPEYGWHSIEGTISGAGWVGTSADYLRFIAAIDGNAQRPDLLSPATLQQMVEKPLLIWANATTWYALGWYSRGGYPNSVVYHGGNTWGTANWVRRMDNGVTFVLLTNGPVAPNEQAVFTALNNALVNATSTITAWPTHDLFGRY